MSTWQTTAVTTTYENCWQHPNSQIPGYFLIDQNTKRGSNTALLHTLAHKFLNASLYDTINDIKFVGELQQFKMYLRQIFV